MTDELGDVTDEREERDIERLAEDLDREAEEMEQRGEQVSDQIDETRGEWQRKQSDAAVPGAAPSEEDADDAGG